MEKNKPKRLPYHNNFTSKPHNLHNILYNDIQIIIWWLYINHRSIISIILFIFITFNDLWDIDFRDFVFEDFIAILFEELDSLYCGIEWIEYFSHLEGDKVCGENI